MTNSFKNELKAVLKVARWEFILKTFTSIVMRGILLVIPILFSFAINYITSKDKDMAVIMIVISIFLVGIYRFFEGYNQVAYYKLYDKIFSYYNDLAISLTKDNSIFSLSRFSLGEYSNIVLNDVSIISSFFSDGVIRIVQLIEFLVIFVYFFSIDIYVFLFTFIVTFVMLVVSLKIGDRIQLYNRDRKIELDKITSSVYDYFGGIREVKSFNIYDKVHPLIENKRKKYLEANTKYNVRFNCINSAILFVFELARLIAVLYIGIRAIEGVKDVGVVLVIYNYYQKIIDNFTIALTLNVEFRNLSVSLQRLNHLREYSSKKQKTLNIDRNKIEGVIEFKNVLYGFRENPILDHLSLKIPKNSITVLAGSNETVETGIYDLLLKLNRQHEGIISIDNIDINEINDEDYFYLVSSVRRDTMFFDISIKDNYLMINSDFNKVLEICKNVGLDEEIMKLKNKYDTIIDENTPLSVSSKKLLVIVRMLLKESKVLLIDNIINVLDEKSEKRLIDLLVEMKKNHTILIVSHSKRIIDRADLVLDISSNYVKEIGK